MKKRYSLVAAVPLFGFYAAWPAISAFQIREALETRDSAAIGQKIDFASVKDSLRPATRAAAERSLKGYLSSSGGAAGVLGEEIAKKALPKLVDLSLNALATPENIGRIYADGGSVTQTLGSIVEQQLARAGGIAGLGGFSGQAGTISGAGSGLGGVLSTLGKAVGFEGGATAGAAKKNPVRTMLESELIETASTQKSATGFGLANIKKAQPTGLLSVEVGFAKDPKVKDADLTVEMRFTGRDWVLTGLRPRI